MLRGSRLLLPLIVAAVCAPGVLTATPGGDFELNIVARLPFAASVPIVCGDADRDGNIEIYLYRSETGLVALEDTGSFQFDTILLRTHTAAAWDIGDTDRDGKTDLLIQHHNVVMLLEAVSPYSLPTELVWADTLRGQGDAHAGIVDGDADSAFEVTCRTFRRPARVLQECTGDNQYERSAWIHTVPFRGSPTAEIVQVADMDGDGKPELAAAANGWAVFYETVGIDTFECSAACSLLQEQGVHGAVATGDMDRDGRLEVVFSGTDFQGISHVWVVEAFADDSFEVVWHDQNQGTGMHDYYLAAGDMDGDSVCEFAYTDGAYVRVYRCIGNDQYEKFWETETNHQAVGLHDINGDGRAELLYNLPWETVIRTYVDSVSVEERGRGALRAVQVRPSVVSRGGVVQLDGLADGASVVVLDASGRVVRVTSENVVQTRGLSVGMYFLRMTAGRSAVLKKLLVVE